LSFVLDASVALAWCFKDESDARAAAALDRLSSTACVAPAIWGLEVGNAVLVAERRGRLTAVEAMDVLSVLRDLQVEIDQTPQTTVFGPVLAIARAQQLSAYDAAYLELSLRRGLPLATLDARLAGAATKLGVDLFRA
jgi:predicted nucleic acid-binding protein